MKTIIALPAAFPLGQTVITAHANSILTSEEVAEGMTRRASGDWGKVPPEDATLNDQSLEHGGRLFSAYRTAKTADASGSSPRPIARSRPC